MDVTDATFQRDVIERSLERPVLVDFWAEWCAPCRMFTPILERVVSETDGDVELAKVNVDENPLVARDLGIQGIPAVKIFRHGQIVGELTGAQPEATVREVVEALRPTEADRLAAAGDEVSLRRALELDPDHREATLGLARLLADRDELTEAEELLKRVPTTPDVEKLAAEIQIRRLQEDTDSHTDPGAAAIAAGDYAAALEHYLARVRESREDEDAREAIVRIFTVLGDTDPLTKAYRPKLASALF